MDILKQPLTQMPEMFSSEDKRLIEMAKTAFEKCIFEKIMAPTGLLKRKWLTPGGYHGHWIWDSMFVVDLLSFLPGNEEILRDAFRIYWDFQDFWNKETPDYAHWMVANNINPGSYTPFTQSECIIAWGMEKIFQHTGETQIINEGIERLERYHDWCWAERDIRGAGLITIGTYAPLIRDSPHNKSGADLLQSARYESFDFQPSLDCLALTPHPARGGPSMYGDICLPDATAFLIQAERSLTRLAKIVGRNDMANRRLHKIEKGVNAMRKHMWDNEAGLFLAVKRDSLEKIQVPCISGFIPLFAEVPTPEQAARMVNELRKPDWFTRLPIPSAPRGSKWFDDDWGRKVSKNGIMWRGDVWNQVNYLICAGLAAYGYKDIASEIADLTVDNVLIHGFNERYHPDSGKPLGVQNLGMSCAAVTMMLEGLTSRHKLMLRETK